MRSLALYVMRGQKQVSLAAIIAMITPMTFWIGTSFVSLFILRNGVKKSSLPIMVGICAGFYWLSKGFALPIVCFISTCMLAWSLRKTASWVTVLMLLIPIGFVVSWVVTTYYAPELKPVIDVLFKSKKELIEHVLENSKNLNLPPQEIILIMLTKSYVSLILTLIIGSLALSRYWQAMLYNAGGFKKEIHSVRLPHLSAILMLCLWLWTLFAPGIFFKSSSVVFSIPLTIAGISLLHGYVAVMQYRQKYLMLFASYLMLLISYPLIIFLTVTDSVFDLRTRYVLKNNISKNKP